MIPPSITTDHVCSVLQELFGAGWAPFQTLSLKSASSPNVKPVEILASIALQFESPPNGSELLDSFVTTQVVQWTTEIIGTPISEGGKLPALDYERLLVELQSILIHFGTRIKDDDEINVVSKCSLTFPYLHPCTLPGTSHAPYLLGYHIIFGITVGRHGSISKHRATIIGTDYMLEIPRLRCSEKLGGNFGYYCSFHTGPE